MKLKLNITMDVTVEYEGTDLDQSQCVNMLDHALEKDIMPFKDPRTQTRFVIKEVNVQGWETVE